MNISHIGIIYDESTEPHTPLEGWHVNSLQKIENADAFLIEVDKPIREFLGVDNSNVFKYKFESKEQANQFIGDADGII